MIILYESNTVTICCVYTREIFKYSNRHGHEQTDSNETHEQVGTARTDRQQLGAGAHAQQQHTRAHNKQ